MQLYVMRHGDALMQAPTDAQRPLSDRGRQQVNGMVDHLLPVLPTCVIASPYVRAQQTANLICDGLGLSSHQLQQADYITPDSDPFRVLRELEPYSREVLLMVSHQPLVGTLLSLLLDGVLVGDYMMGTASLACLQLENIGAGQAQLQWLRHAV